VYNKYFVEKYVHLITLILTQKETNDNVYLIMLYVKFIVRKERLKIGKGNNVYRYRSLKFSFKDKFNIWLVKIK